MADIQKIADDLSSLTVLTSELTKILEENGAYPLQHLQSCSTGIGKRGDAAAEKKSEFELHLQVLVKKINVIKEVRTITGLGLKKLKI